jgi:hypothetical protein
MRRPNIRWIFIAVLALAVLAARVGFTPPAAQVAPAVFQQEETPFPGDDDGVPATGGETVDEVGERQAGEVDRAGNWPLLVLFGIVFLVVIIGLLTRARAHRFPR